MTKSFPSSPVAQGSRVNLTCRTDSANPTAQIKWRRQNSDYISDGSEYIIKSSAVIGEFHAMQSISTLSFIATKQHTGNPFQCVVYGRDKLFLAGSTLSVNCKYPVSKHMHIYNRLFNFHDHTVFVFLCKVICPM